PDDADPRSLREVLAQRAFTKLGGGARPIPDEKVGEVAATVAAQVQLAREAGAEDVSVVATAAIRDAANGGALCAAVRRACGVGGAARPGAAGLAAVRAAVADELAVVAPPVSPVAAYAVGGSATSLRRLLGETVDRAALARAVAAIASAPAHDIADRFDLHPD